MNPATIKWRFGIKKKIITRSDAVPYLIRYTIFSCPLFSIKIHNLLISDDDCLHDHPWAFVSLILWGGYVEHTNIYVHTTGQYENGQDLDRWDTKKKSKIYHPLSVLYRPAKWQHKLEIHQPAWTLVITFKKIRMWGFWTRNGFVPFFKYRGGGCE